MATGRSHRVRWQEERQVELPAVMRAAIERIEGRTSL